MKDKKNLYDVLGVDKNASQDDIKKAYHKKGKKAHTDKGGEHSEMTEINNAYAVLKIPSKREFYDRTGEENDTPFDKKFHGFIQEVFVQAIVNTAGDIESEDLISLFKQKIDDFICHNEQQREGVSGQIDKLNKIIARCKSKKQNMINVVLEGNIQGLRAKVAHLDDMTSFLKLAYDHLKDYTYEFEPKPKRTVKWEKYTPFDRPFMNDEMRQAFEDEILGRRTKSRFR